MIRGFIAALMVGICGDALASAPAWDARGCPLPRQPVCSVAVSPGGEWVAVGTGAVAGDANCFLLSAADGSLKRSFAIGQRWVRDLRVGDDGAIVGVVDYPTGVTAEAPATFVARADGTVSLTLSKF